MKTFVNSAGKSVDVPDSLVPFTVTLPNAMRDFNGFLLPKDALVLVDDPGNPKDGHVVLYDPRNFTTPEFQGIVEGAIYHYQAYLPNAVGDCAALKNKFETTIDANLASSVGRRFPLLKNTVASSFLWSPRIRSIEQIKNLSEDLSKAALDVLLNLARQTVDMTRVPAALGNIKQAVPNNSWTDKIKPCISVKIFKVSGGMFFAREIYVAEIFIVPIEYDYNHCWFKIGDSATGQMLDEIINLVQKRLGEEKNIFFTVAAGAKADQSFKARQGDGFEVVACAPQVVTRASTVKYRWQVDEPSMLDRLYPYRDFCDLLKPVTGHELLGVVKSVIDDVFSDSYRSTMTLEEIKDGVGNYHDANIDMTGFPTVRESVIISKVMWLADNDPQKYKPTISRKEKVLIVRQMGRGDRRYRSREWIGYRFWHYFFMWLPKMPLILDALALGLKFLVTGAIASYAATSPFVARICSILTVPLHWEWLRQSWKFFNMGRPLFLVVFMLSCILWDKWIENRYTAER